MKVRRRRVRRIRDRHRTCRARLDFIHQPEEFFSGLSSERFTLASGDCSTESNADGIGRSLIWFSHSGHGGVRSICPRCP